MGTFTEVSHGVQHRRLIDAIHDATLAASVHNSQPWRFVASPHQVEVWLDLSNRPSIIDDDGRWAVQSVGGALANLELGVRCRLERSATVRLLPPAARRPSPAPGAGAPGGHRLEQLAAGPVATLRVGQEAEPPDEAETSLHDAIALRRTSRWPSLAPVGEGPLRALVAAALGSALTEGVELLLPADNEVTGLLELTDDVERSWTDDVAYLAEVERWAHREDGLGIPATAIGPGDVAGGYPGRDFAVGVSGTHTAPSAERFEERPELVVVRTSGDDHADLLRAGAAAQRVMLAATATGVDVGVLGQLVEQDLARARAGRLLGGADPGTIQQVLRAGLSDPTRHQLPHTPRRSLDDLVTWRR